MALSPTTRLGQYEIVAPIGAGGMGEVYRARDTKLERDVALKVLPPRLAAEPGALARFEREAKAVAALSHPNILAIHDFGEDDGRQYAVAELLEGQTLSQMLAGGPLSPRKAVEYARQIAEGLAAAHDRGIVHRDLKPDNLFVTKDGHVKILDFGLAKQNVAPGEAGSGDTNSPTRARPTEPGTVLGTAGYMAPEQVRGQAVDHRGDIFSFGAVLYEMLAGRRAFERATSAETMTAVLREEPVPLSELIPPALTRVVEHCLEKRPEDRFQSARDLAFDLGSSTSSTGRSAVTAMPKAMTRRLAIPALVGASALLVGLAGGALLQRRFAPPAATPSLPEVRYLTYSGQDYSPAASPDGRSVAFRSDRDGRARIWLKQLATGTEAPLTDGPVDDLPQFSPDGSLILFTRWSGIGASLYRVPLLGGEPRRVLDDAEDASWSPDGQRIAFVRAEAAAPGKTAAAALMVAASDGSAPRLITRLEVAGILGPRWSPDARKLAFAVTGVGAGTFTLQVADVESGAVETRVAPNPTSRPWASLWTSSGRLVYTSGQLTGGTLAGTAGRVLALEPKSGQTTLLYATPDSLGRLAPLGDERIVLESQRFQQNIVEWAPFAAAPIRHFSQGRAANRQPVYSPDGKWLVFSSDRAGNLDLWAASLNTSELRQLTDDPADDWDPGFSASGRLVWSSNRSGNFEIWTAEGDGGGARQLTHDGTDAENPSVSPDGRYVVYGSTRPREAGLWRMRMDGTESKLLIAGRVGIPEVSPDGKYALYIGFGARLKGSAIGVVRLEDGAAVPFEIEVETVRPTTANLGRAHWTSDGKIAFLGQDERGINGLFVQDFAPGRDTTATRRKLSGFDADVGAESFGISPDGRRIAIAGREMVSSLVLLEGLKGLAGPQR